MFKKFFCSMLLFLACLTINAACADVVINIQEEPNLQEIKETDEVRAEKDRITKELLAKEQQIRDIRRSHLRAYEKRLMINNLRAEMKKLNKDFAKIK